MGSASCCDRAEDKQELTKIPQEAIPGSAVFPNIEDDELAATSSDTPSERHNFACPTAASVVRNAIEEFTVTVHRSKRDLLGVEVDSVEGGLLIESLEAGLIQEWNMSNPNMMVRQGDRITAVNGFREVPKVVEECKTEQVLVMTIVRGMPQD
mmetsp:Transcript_6434/g.17914  ORF Transcript_6434/g.17914 Transcript_6434/m.17914 type:complete len:153 (-) Transcript_6434:150-608(-)|eukprot:CAMPEP_0194482182 /NCGR_PEP_ID=MMETSP0253-20130528/4253_1 /TAXON_ID=2966 /ORGANISM="Noctiluca scintillans" /LENGTH=152 /DNA_ID=CAMNT_0039321705 /DNA_START=62 /DNA_END=520 /DNA_ORIENTATION=+